MKTLATATIKVPTRNNSTLRDLFPENAENYVIRFEHEGDALAVLEFNAANGQDLFRMVRSENQFATMTKFTEKYLSGKYLNPQELDDVLYNFQKRIKSCQKVIAPQVQEAPEKPVAPVEPKPEIRIEEPRREPVQVQTKPRVGLEGQIYQLVEEGINAKETTEYINKKVSHRLDELGVVPNRVDLFVKVADHKEVNIGSVHKDFENILMTMAAGVNVALVGPAGSGKTTTVEKVAEALNLRFFSKSVSAQTGTHEFFGYQNANGQYVSTLFRDCYENGGVFLLDEFDAGNSNVLAALNQATANGSAAFADKMVKKHADFKIVMAGNTWGHGATSEYVGRNKIDAATLDRFAFIYFDYDEDLEIQIACNREWTKKVQRIRKVVFDKKIKAVVSPRASINGGLMLKTGMDESKVIEYIILKGLGKDERAMLKAVCEN